MGHSESWQRTANQVWGQSPNLQSQSLSSNFVQGVSPQFRPQSQSPNLILKIHYVLREKYGNIWSTVYKGVIDLIQERNIGLAIIFTIITCGLYGIYWMYSLTNEVGHLSDDPSFTGGKVILFSIITCGIYTLFWYYQLGGQIARAQQNKGYPSKDDGALLLVVALLSFGIISMAIAQSNVNRLV